MPSEKKHRYPAAKPSRTTPIGTPLRLHVKRTAQVERPEVAEIQVRLVPVAEQLARLAEEDRAEVVSEAEKLTACDFFLDKQTGELDLASDFLRRYFTVEEVRCGDFQYDGFGEGYLISCRYDRLEDV